MLFKLSCPSQNVDAVDRLVDNNESNAESVWFIPCWLCSQCKSSGRARPALSSLSRSCGHFSQLIDIDILLLEFATNFESIFDVQYSDILRHHFGVLD